MLLIVNKIGLKFTYFLILEFLLNQHRNIYIVLVSQKLRSGGIPIDKEQLAICSYCSLGNFDKNIC